MKKYIYQLNKNQLKKYRKIAIDKSYGIITEKEFKKQLDYIINSIIINFFIKRNKNNSCKEYLAVINYNNNFNSNYYIAIKQRKDNNNG